MKKIWYAPNQFEAYGEEEIAAVTEALRAGWLAGWGPRTVEFEQRAEAAGDQDPVLLGMHRGMRGRVAVVMAAGMQQRVQHVQEQFLARAVRAPCPAARGLVDADGDVAVDGRAGRVLRGQ